MAIYEPCWNLACLFLQLFICNLLFGFIYCCCIEISKSTRQALALTGRSSLGKILESGWTNCKAKLTAKLQLLKNDRKWLLIVSFKTLMDVAIFNFTTFGLDVNGSPAINIDLLTRSLVLSPANLMWVLSITDDHYIEDSLAKGLAWSVYFGFLQITAPFLQDCIHSSRYESELASLAKRFVLIPANGKVVDVMENADERIAFVENTSSIKIENAGIRNRQYHHSIYKFSPKNAEFEEFYCLVEQCAIVRTIQKMEENGLINSTTTINTIRKLYQILNEIVQRDPTMKSRIDIVLFSGLKEDLVNTIVQRRNEIVGR